MGEKISIAKAARVLGINRHELCDRLCRAGVESFEGAVDLEEVQGIAPKLRLNPDVMSERTRLIRQTARRRGAVKEPRKKVFELQDELDKMHNKWLLERKKAQEFSVLFDGIIDELGRWQTSDDPEKSKFALEFAHWICDQFD